MGNPTINGTNSYFIGSNKQKELCRPMSENTRVVVLNCILHENDKATSKITIMDRDTGDTRFAISGITGDTAVFLMK